MKTRNKLITTVTIILCYTFCNAQKYNYPNTPAQWLAFHKDELKECPYIFEGTVTEQSSKGGGNLSRCCVIQITKIYKGSPQLKLGTIKVLTQDRKSTDAPLSISKGYTYIIFGKLANSKTFDTIIADNSVTLWCYDHANIYSIGASWGWRKVTHYPIVDSLYSFFQQNGVMIQEQVPQADSTKH